MLSDIKSLVLIQLVHIRFNIYFVYTVHCFYGDKYVHVRTFAIDPGVAL